MGRLREVVRAGPRAALARFDPAADFEAVHEFAVGRRHWGQGYATEVARMLIELNFGRLPLRENFDGLSRATGMP